MKSSLVNMVLSLGTITIVAGALLAWVFSMTEAPIAQADLNKQIVAVSAVTPQFANDPVAEAVEVTPEGEAAPLKVFPARDAQGAIVGAAVESYSSAGFSGDIKLIYGFDAEGNVTGYEVMSHAETPGLGAKMGEWFKMPEGRRSVIGLNPSATEGGLTVAKDGGQVDAITAATITSRAFLDALNRASRAFTAYKQQSSNN